MKSTETQKKKKKNKRACVFGYPVNILNFKKAASFVLRCMKNKQGVQVVTINPEMIANADENPQLAEVIKRAELVIPDSIGIALALDSIGVVKVQKIPGIDFSERLIKKCAKKGYRVAFLGGSKETNIALNAEIMKKYPKLNVVFSHHGFFEDSEVNEINNKLQEVEPHILFVALGTPKQEFFIDNCRKFLSGTVMIGVGGSFDVWAKRVKRAPVIFRIFGLEWFYRLVTEPKRFSRMFPVLPNFFFRIMFDRANLRKEY